MSTENQDRITSLSITEPQVSSDCGSHRECGSSIWTVAYGRNCWLPTQHLLSSSLLFREIPTCGKELEIKPLLSYHDSLLQVWHNFSHRDQSRNFWGIWVTSFFTDPGAASFLSCFPLPDVWNVEVMAWATMAIWQPLCNH